MRIIGIIAFLTAGPQTWQAIRQMQFKYMILALVLGVLTVFLDSMILKILSLAAGTKISFYYCLETILFYLFLSSITPTITDGEPLMFSSSVPIHLLGIFVILRRFFTIYIWVILGGLLITKTIGLDILDKISTP